MSSLVTSERAAAPISRSRAILRDLLIVAAVGAGIWMAHRLANV